MGGTVRYTGGASMSIRFPDDPIFRRLATTAQSKDQIVCHDSSTGLSVTYHQLISDILQMRDLLRTRLSDFMSSEQLIFDQTLHIGYLGKPNYEFIVAAFAVLALGGMVIPLPKHLPTDDLIQIAEKDSLLCVLVGSAFSERVPRIQERASCLGIGRVELIPIITMMEAPSGPLIHIDKQMTISGSRPAICFFTSGSTGLPKGVIHSRELFYNRPPAGPDEVMLVSRPVNWAGGALPVLISVLCGQRAEIVDPDSQPNEIWEVVRSAGITHVISTPPLYDRLAQYYQDSIQYLPERQREEYLNAVQKIKYAFISGAVPAMSLLRYWRDTLRKPLTVTYGSSELCHVITRLAPGIELERCIGEPVSPNYEIKLSDGDSGELLIKGPFTFIGYLGNRIPYASVFDEAGFYRTGDLAHKVGNNYVMDGRASVDFIESAGGLVPVLELESELLKLPYIAEAYALPVQGDTIDNEVGVLCRFQRVNGALCVLQRHEHMLQDIRADLAARVPEFMLPKALRVFESETMIPRLDSGKVSKKTAMEMFFKVDCNRIVTKDAELCFS